MSEKVENRGGKREGAGRKPIYELGEQKRREILKDFDELAASKKSSIGKELAKMVFGKDQRLKMTAMQLIVRDVLPKSAERDVTVTNIDKPQVFLPQELADDDGAGEYSARH